jgi:hypothetical protein
VPTGVTPAQGPAIGGTTIQIKGTNLANALYVRFYDLATNILETGTSTFISDTSTNITLTTLPVGNYHGTTYIVVGNSQGASVGKAVRFTYTSVAPTVTGVSPNEGPATGGQTITVTGTNFEVGGSKVVKAVNLVNAAGDAVGVPNSAIKYLGPTQLQITTPGLGTNPVGKYNILVDTAYGESAVNANDVYTYLNVPTVTGVKPGNGPIAGGTLVTITGTHFAGADTETINTVWFDSMAATPFNVTATSLQVYAPEHAAGTVDVRVAADHVESPVSTADQYTYYASKFITFSIVAPQALVSQGIYLQMFGQQIPAPYTATAGTGIYFSYTGVNTGGWAVVSKATLPTPPALRFGPVKADGNRTAVVQVLDPIYAVHPYGIIGGEMVLSVGSPPSISAPGGVGSVPTPGTAPTKIFAVGEFSVNAAASTAYTAGNLDIDLSYVDQVGVPLTLSANGTPAPSFPYNGGVGTTLDRQTLFNDYASYVQGLVNGGTTSAGAFAELLPSDNGYRIIAPQDLLSIDEATPPPGAPAVSGVKVSGGQLTRPTPQQPGYGTGYYYVVTAVSATGESQGSPGIGFQMTSGQNAALITWTPFAASFPNAVGYNIYRGTVQYPPSPANPIYSTTLYKLNATPISGLSYLDDGSTSGTQLSPPANSFGYDPLGKYFDSALGAFFQNYTTSNSFSIHRDGDLFTGQTQSNFTYLAPDGATHSYAGRALVLTDQTQPTHYQYLIVDPRWSTNGYPGNAAPPSWLNQFDTVSPGQQIFGAEGAMGSAGEPGDAGGSPDIQKDLENSIATAFNRGIATQFSLAPDNWADPPVSFQARHDAAASTLPAGTYYYVITGVDAQGETTASLEQSVTTTATDPSAELSWSTTPQNLYPGFTTFTSFNIYRGNSSGGENQLIATVSGATGEYVDSNQGTPTAQNPPTYWASGSTSNWYEAFLHQPGVSINGLAYGYAYDDQGSFSTNFTVANPTSVTFTLRPWTGSVETPASLQFVTPPHDQLAGSSLAPVVVELLTPEGTPLLGSDLNVTVTVTAPDGGPTPGVPTSVQVSYLTGLATISFGPLAKGTYATGQYTFEVSVDGLDLQQTFNVFG